MSPDFDVVLSYLDVGLLRIQLSMLSGFVGEVNKRFTRTLYINTHARVIYFCHCRYP